jgi:hypothetical protein
MPGYKLYLEILINDHLIDAYQSVIYGDKKDQFLN